MPKKIEVREGDWVIVRLPVKYVTDKDDRGQQRMTVQIANQRVTAELDLFDVVRTEKGGNWPD